MCEISSKVTQDREIFISHNECNFSESHYCCHVIFLLLQCILAVVGTLSFAVVEWRNYAPVTRKEVHSSLDGEYKHIQNSD